LKLIRFGNPGEEKPGLQLEDGRRIDASAFGSDYDEKFFGGDDLHAFVIEEVLHHIRATPAAADERQRGAVRRSDRAVFADC
jgi:hypothetical protein